MTDEIEDDEDKEVEDNEEVEDETIIGVHSSGIQLEEGINTSLSRNYCANCKRNIHCYVKVDRETNEAIVHKTCKNNDCECKCKTHYACKRCGYLHPYGEKCTKLLNSRPQNPQAAKELDELLESWNESKKQKLEEVPKCVDT